MKKKVIEIAAVCVLFLVLAAFMDKQNESVVENSISRNAVGEGEKNVELYLNADGLEKDYLYELDVAEIIPTEKTAQEYFEMAREEIDESFCSDGESVERVTKTVSMAESYVDGAVLAEWMLDDYSAIDAEGNITGEEIDESGQLITASVQLKCGEYRSLYEFSFMLYPKKLSKGQQLIKDIGTEIDKSLSVAGDDSLILPDEVDGIKLDWTEKGEKLFLKILMLEIVCGFLFLFSMCEKKKERLKERNISMKLEYPEIVSKMAVLIGAGMTIEQSWGRISARYSEKRQKDKISKKPIYDEMILTGREISDGESSKNAYMRFAERVNLGCYQRFIRILMQSIQKGTNGLCDMLEKEADDAFKERKLLARKRGEEASTKMLLPMMLMMVIVMAIVIAPAIIDFKA